MTHDALVERAAKWLRGTMRCKPVFTEVRTILGGESPDAIGWQGNGESVLVECKTTLNDLYADGAKEFRQRPAMGMGVLRYYLVPQRMGLPQHFNFDGWGLLRAGLRRIQRVRRSDHFTVSLQGEIQILRARYNALAAEWDDRGVAR